VGVPTVKLFNPVETYGDGSTYRWKWYECQPFHQILLLRWSLTRKGWHPKRKRLARLRSFYWTLFRLHETEICARCGGPVKLCFHVPDAIWKAHAGFAQTKRDSGGESAPGVLCPGCFTDLAAENGAHCLWWTCGFDDELMRG
jgi:hypothetical protein